MGTLFIFLFRYVWVPSSVPSCPVVRPVVRPVVVARPLSVRPLSVRRRRRPSSVRPSVPSSIVVVCPLSVRPVVRHISQQLSSSGKLPGSVFQLSTCTFSATEKLGITENKLDSVLPVF